MQHEYRNKKNILTTFYILQSTGGFKSLQWERNFTGYNWARDLNLLKLSLRKYGFQALFYSNIPVKTT